MRLPIMLALAALASPAAETSDPGWDKFATTLHSILRAAGKRFLDVEGARVENRRREYFFESKTYLPEASYCRILSQGGPVFCCEWDGRGAAASEALYRKYVTLIEGALGEGWTKVAKSAGSGRRRAESLFTAEDKPVVHVILETAPAQVYVLVLEPGASKDGFTGQIPSISGFIHP